MNDIEKNIMLGMIDILNEANNAYYNTGKPIMTDEQFDARLRDLQEFEEETGIVFSHSPTQRVGAKVLNELTEVTTLIRCSVLTSATALTNYLSLLTTRKLLQASNLMD